MANITRDIIAAIDVIDEHIVGSSLSVDIDERTTTDIGHTGTAEDLVDITGTERHGGITSHITLVAAAIDAARNHDLSLR